MGYRFLVHSSYRLPLTQPLYTYRVDEQQTKERFDDEEDDEDDFQPLMPDEVRLLLFLSLSLTMILTSRVSASERTDAATSHFRPRILQRAAQT